MCTVDELVACKFAVVCFWVKISIASFSTRKKK